MLTLTKTQDALLFQKTHYMATLWKIIRTDATMYYFTDHNHQLEFESQTYTPVGGFSSSARELKSNTKASNYDIIGVISSSAIDDDDIRAGLFREAQIIEYTIDWRVPWFGALTIDKYWIASITWDGNKWNAQLVTISLQLKQEIGDVYGRTCRYELGDAECTVNLATFTYPGAITVVDEQRWSFETDLIGYADDYFQYGYIIFTSGLNNGLTFPIQRYTNTNGKVYLADAASFDLSTDSFNIVAGCGKTTLPCKDTFANFDNFGGFPAIPGNDKMFETP